MMNVKQMIAMGALAVLSLFGTVTEVRAQQNDKVPTVDIQANVQREVMPDELVLSITIKESDYKGKTTLQDKQREMIQVLKKNKVNYEEDLTISQLGSMATFRMFSKNPTPRTEATYFLKLYDTGTMQRVVAQLEEEKITNIDLIRTRYTQEDQLKLELGAEAAKKAKVEAENLAQAVGQGIGKAVSISSWMTNSSPRPSVYKRALMMSADAVNVESAAGAGAEPVPGIARIRYTVSVSVKFELK